MFNAKWKKALKYFTLAILSIVVSFALFYVMLISVDPVHLGANFNKEIDEKHFLTEFTKLDHTKKGYISEYNGGDFIVTIFFYEKDEEYNNVSKENLGDDKYYEFDTVPVTKVRVEDWHHVSLLEVINYFMWNDNNFGYYVYIDEETGEPIYWHMAELRIEKGNSYYKVSVYCNSQDRLNGAITEMVENINAME